MVSKVVYRLTDGKVVFWVSTGNIDMVSPQYDDTVNGCAVCDIPAEMASDYSHYFYVAGAIAKDYYGKLSLASDKSSMPADGSSMATFTITKFDGNGVPMNSAGDNDVVSISTTRGTLSATTVTLVNGVGTFTLTSITETIPLTVSVSSGNLGASSFTVDLTA